MESILKYTGKYKFEADNGRNHTTKYSSKGLEGGDENAATPMEIMLQSVAACSGIDVVTILGKKRKNIESLEITITGERRDEHPQIFTKAHLHYVLKSDNAELKDLNRSVELSQDKYCGASAMFKLAGAEVTWSAELL
jgi:putative redox protein